MSKLLKQYGKFILLVTGVLATAFLLLDAFVIGDASEATSGLDVIFGAESTFIGITAKFKFNILLFVAFLAPLAAGIVGVVLENKNKPLITTLLFVVSIMLLLVTSKTTYEASVLGQTVATDVDVSLALFGWLSVVFSGIGALTSVGLLLENK